MNVKKLSSPLLLFTILFSIIVLSGCIPTIQRFYFAPTVMGTVLDMQTLKPIANAKVSYAESDEEAVLTKEDGTFTLPSISRIEASILMAGHALNEHRIHVTHRTGSADTYVTGSLRSIYEEFFDSVVIFIDTKPDAISKRIKPEHVDYALLRTGLYPHSTFGQCDIPLGYLALGALNSSRKLYWTQSFGLNPMINKTMVQKSYDDVEMLWRDFSNSCELEFEDKMEVYEMVGLVIDEVSEVLRPTTDN